MSKTLSICTFEGMAILGAIIQRSKSGMQQIPFILTGIYEKELRCAFYTISREPREFPTSEEQIQSSEITYAYEGFLKDLREFVEEVFRDFNSEKRESDKKKVLNELAESSKPHALGTIAEIAVRNNISKSEVRRLKAANLLHTLK